MDPAGVDSRRAAWGFEPLETYIEQVAAGVRQGGVGDGWQRA
ncbi:hypothetical protein ACH4TC_00870 [Streptomyces spororaveus]